jgi:ribosomal protein S18 acetylase RimI-like enzyme
MSTIKEIPKIMKFEFSNDTSSYILPYTAKKHMVEMGKNNILYLSIYQGQLFLGFIILSLESTDTVEFRRIVVGPKDSGFGQSAIKKMEEYCQSILKKNRIWLDVFEKNLRGQHIYKKLGYRLFKTGIYKGQRLLYFEKNI